MKTHLLHRRTWSAFLVALMSIIVSFPSHAYAQPDYPEEPTIRKLAYTWYQSKYISNRNAYTQIADSFYFENEQERQRFIDGRPDPNPLEEGVMVQPSQPSDILIAPRPKGVSDFAPMKAWVFIPKFGETGRNKIYYWQELNFSYIDNEWKIRFDPYFPTPKEVNDRENQDMSTTLQIERLEAESNRWTNAQGEALRRLSSQRRDDALYLIAANKYAEEKGISSMSEKRLEEAKREAAELSQMTPTQVKAKMTEEIHDKIDRLRQRLEDEKARRELLKNRPTREG